MRGERCKSINSESDTAEEKGLRRLPTGRGKCNPQRESVAIIKSEDASFAVEKAQHRRDIEQAGRARKSGKGKKRRQATQADRRCAKSKP